MRRVTTLTFDTALEVLFQIFEITYIRLEPAWATKVVEELPHRSKVDVLAAIDMLFDLGFIEYDSGYMEKWRIGLLIYLVEKHVYKIEELYYEYE